MKTYDQGIKDEQDRVIAIFDEYDITQLVGGAIILVPKKKAPGITHTTGSLSSYFRNGCRCDTCKKVASEYVKQRKARNISA